MDLTDSLTIQENVELAPLTTLKVGGPARFFAEVASEDEVIKAFNFARENRLPVFILGGGSNLLVADEGFDGMVIKIVLKGIRSERHLSREVITAGAGEDWVNFVARCVNSDLAGLECLSGIPGFVGGTPVQNVGAYGQEVSETIVSVRCLDRGNLNILELSNKDCGFAYRTSIFNTTMRERYVVLSVTFSLGVGEPPKIAYKDLREYFGDRQPTLAETRAAIIKIRAAKSMVIDPTDPNSRSAGSFFKNPIVSSEKLAEIEELVKGENVPRFAAGNGMAKIPAAWLIEKAGFQKGFCLGNAGISTNHSLALINRGGANAAEILRLKNLIVEGVFSKFEIELLPEPVFVGFRDRG